ncbi:MULTISPECIES: conjugative transposon protein TraK [Bacteroidales]|jgi:conjugative transposon TraK protein|uniref:Conjugative transposon TraK protein n=1 Tax=Segatella buccae ATCC 33574 TaxID=873513 RepID=E6K6T2_9BACT|nr:MULTISPECIES: conjugative transposon protein TraK [Bacteroidales]EFU30762.1 conjugative transposon TraK protein [Segatella buccae ATCC 33574]MCE2616412.1 conjugative transposon protein TraK [Phocaeicola oris]
MAVLKKLENKIKLVLIITSLFLIGCVVISLGSLFVARGMVADAHKKIYVLDGTVPILVKQTTMDETFEVEAKSHVEMFHNLFFTLAPDDKYIDYTIKKAMYLIDESGLAQYNALKEKGFYNNIIGTSTICSIFCDSIKLDKQKMTFTYYGRQRIERRTSILMRQLITAGSLRRVPRTENNPHGFIIFGWRTLVNKDLSENQKTNF